MGRTATNVVGNGIATSVIAKWEGELDEDAGRRALENSRA
jgi:Na+/H+-dicarboxylate symporter